MNSVEQSALEQNAATVEEEIDKEQKAREKAVIQRKIQALNLNRARVAEQIERSGSERYQQLLKQELEHIDRQLAELQ